MIACQCKRIVQCNGDTSRGQHRDLKRIERLHGMAWHGMAWHGDSIVTVTYFSFHSSSASLKRLRILLSASPIYL